MNRTDPCSRIELELLLEDRLTEERQRRVEAHLESCPSCRFRLERLAADEQWWHDLRCGLGTDGERHMTPTTDHPGRMRRSPPDLRFLQPSNDSDSIGRLGKYEILEVIGHGGMGVVLKGFDPDLHRPVAIKVLASEYAVSPESRRRFAREAQAAAAVIHDHVVPVHAVDAMATPPYIVMAYICGQSLQQRIDASGPLTVPEILRIGMQTASGLAAAHAQGLVHRDIKPANIMLENGVERVRITDFGLARAVDDLSVTQTGALAGTPQYMAPEQARGESVDQRADLFALGSTLYAMATGNPPFQAMSGLAILRKVADESPPSVLAANPSIPSWLAGFISKLHAKEPEDRIQTAGEAAELLEGCLAHVQHPQKFPLPPIVRGFARPAAGSMRRIQSVAGRRLVACAALLAIAGTTGFWVVQGRSSGRKSPALTRANAAAPPAFPSVTEIDRLIDGLRDGMARSSEGFRAAPEPLFDHLSMRSLELRHRIEALRHWLQIDDAANNVDPMPVRIWEMRARIERLQSQMHEPSSR